MYIIIVGLGGIGQSLAGIAVTEKHNVVVVDTSPQKCKDIAMQWDLVTINGDASNLAVLEEAGINEADALVSTTSSDAVNLMVTLHARKKNVKHIRTIVNQAENLDIFKQEGITVHKNPNAIVAEDIFNAMLRPNISDFVTIAGGKAEILEISIGEHSKVNGKKIGEVGLPANVQIIAIERDGDVVAHNENTVLKAGDTLFVFVRRGLVDRLFDMFSAGDLVK